MNLLGGISYLTAQVFFDGLWQGIVLAAAVAVCFRLYPGVSAAVRFAIWSFAFALTLITPLLHLHLFSVRSANASATIVHLGAVWAYSIAGVWAALIVVRAVRFAVHVIWLLRIWRRATPILSDGEIGKALQSSKRPVELCVSGDVDSPSVIGFWSARLLVPEWLLPKVSSKDLLQVVLHELEHLRRRDDWINLMQKIGLVLFPINPTLFWIDRRLTFERELACDAGVVASTAAPFGYATCLTRLAEHRLRHRRTTLLLSAWGRQSELARRVQSLLRPAHRLSSLQTKVATALLGVALSAIGLGMVRTPRFVSFAGGAGSVPIVEAFAPVVTSPVNPVNYHNVGRPHATLVKAVVPPRKPRPFSPVAFTRHRGEMHLHKARAAGVPKQPHLLLTTASVSSASDSPDWKVVRTIYVLPAEFSPSYPAVTVSDGWLIIQL